MRVLVTGATGFLGNHVIKELFKHNVDVIASSSNLEKAQNSSWYKEVYTYKSLNLANSIRDNLFNFFEQPDVIIHLAWSGLPRYKELFHYEEVLPEQYHFLKNLIINGSGNLCISGTCLEYGLREGELDESLVPNPQNPYAIAKDTLRKFLEELQKQVPFSLKWARLFYMYGAGQNPKSILAQLDKALQENAPSFNMSAGEQLRDYLAVEKVAQYLVAIALQNDIQGIINCCSGAPISVKELVENHLKKRHKQIQLNLGFYPYPDYEPMAFWGNIHKLKQIIHHESH